MDAYLLNCSSSSVLSSRTGLGPYLIAVPKGKAFASSSLQQVKSSWYCAGLINVSSGPAWQPAAWPLERSQDTIWTIPTCSLLGSQLSEMGLTPKVAKVFGMDIPGAAFPLGHVWKTPECFFAGIPGEGAK